VQIFNSSEILQRRFYFDPEKPSRGTAMSENKKTIEKYMHAFEHSDHSAVLSCLTDDVEWILPGVFRLQGKEAFDKEIENDAFVGSPKITVSRVIEESEIVVAEGSVRAKRRDGGTLHAVFCDVFEMKDTKIKRLISYLMEIKDSAGPV